MRNYTSSTRPKQAFNSQVVVDGVIPFARGGRGMRFKFTRGAMRCSKWLESRIRRMVESGATVESVVAAVASGVCVVTRQGKARRQMSKAIAPVRRQATAAPVVARACVRETAEKSVDDGGGDDSGGDDAGPDDARPDVAPECFPLASLLGVVR